MIFTQIISFIERFDKGHALHTPDYVRSQAWPPAKWIHFSLIFFYPNAYKATGFFSYSKSADRYTGLEPVLGSKLRISVEFISLSIQKISVGQVSE